MTTAVLALVLSGLGLLGGGLVMFFKVVAHLTRIETYAQQSAKLAAHVPNLNYRMTNVERMLEISTPDLPVFMNGHHSEE